MSHMLAVGVSVRTHPGRVKRHTADGARLGPIDTNDHVRIDQWLWAVRLVKTRSQATAACRAGHVRINGTTVKPAHAVRVGDRVQAFLHQREREVEVVRLLVKRVGAPIAAECLVDHSPAPPPRYEEAVPRRDRGAGRPTKRDRRKIDELRGRRSR